MKALLLYVLLVVLQRQSLVISCQQSNPETLPFMKTLPKFSYETIKNATSLDVNENTPLNTTILSVQASTYQQALPMIYLIENPSPYFKVDPSSGSLILANPLRNQLMTSSLQIRIVAKDSAPFPDQQSSYLHVNINIARLQKYRPEFNNYEPHYSIVPDFIQPGYIVYDKISLTDNNNGKFGAIQVSCDSNNAQNIDAQTSCEYFTIHCQSSDQNIYQCFVRLAKQLNFRSKRSFIISIKAMVNNEPSLTSSMNMIVDVSNSMYLSPKFTHSSYNIILNSNSQLATNVLDVRVANIDTSQPCTITFVLSDPQSLFTIDHKTHACNGSEFSNSIVFKNRFSRITSYPMEVSFTLQSSSYVYTSKASVQVVIERQLIARNAPKFSSASYQYQISEDLQPGSIIRSTHVTVYESEELSVYSSGFDLELLNTDYTSADGMFDVVPKYGEGTLVASLIYKNPNFLDFESNIGKLKFEYILKAKSRSSSGLASYANVTLYVNDFNEYSPVFEKSLYKVVINNPEVYQSGDILTTVVARDGDRSESSLFFSITGLYQDKFYVDLFGNIRLRNIFSLDTNKDFVYNLTVSARDSGGLHGFANVVIYLNVYAITSIQQQYSFGCALDGAKSELNADNMSLYPPLYITANSIYPLKHFLLQSVPSLKQLNIDAVTGQIYLSSPLNSTIMSEYDKAVVTMQIFQLQPLDTNLYLSSIICTGTIYLQPFSSPGVIQRQPHFLRQYSVTIDRESVNRSLPLVKVDAISMNPFNLMPVSFRLLNNEYSGLFIIDSTQGYIYPRYDLGLEPKTYIVKIQASDPSNGQFSVSDVYISIVFKQGNSLTCNTSFLNLRINPDDVKPEVNNPAFLGQISCTSSSLFKDTPILYDITSPLATFDCNGNQINFTPRIGIDSSKGRIVSFEWLSRSNFCDSSFKLIITKDDKTVTIPFKLFLVSNILQNNLPVFNNLNSDVSHVPYYGFIGNYITSIIAFDPLKLTLIENYEIVSQPINLNTNKPYFSIDKTSGFIRLNSLFEKNLNFPLVQNILLQISATTTDGLKSVFDLTVDMSRILSNYYASFAFDSNLPGTLTLGESSVYTNPILKVSTLCFQLYQTNELTYCDIDQYSLDYLTDGANSPQFLINSESRNIYIVAPDAIGKDLVSSKHLITINSTRTSSGPRLERYLQYTQNNLTVYIAPIQLAYPLFEKAFYKIYMTENTLANTCILSMPFKFNPISDTHDIQIEFEQRSNLQIENYFYVQYSLVSKMVYLYVRSLPYPYDKPEIEFNIKFNMGQTTTKSNEFNSRTKISISVLSSYLQRSDSSVFQFTRPETSNKFAVVHVNFNYRFSNIIYEFQATKPTTTSHIVYRIMNPDFYFLSIENNFLRFVYPLSSLDDFKRSEYLLFIEARDISNPAINPIYTTLQLSLIETYPYFTRKPGSGQLFLNVEESTPLNIPFYNISSLIYNPTDSPLFFYVHDNQYPFYQSETFYMGNVNASLKLKKPLNARERDFYRLYVFVNNNSTIGRCEGAPSNKNESLLFIDIRVLSKSSNLNFLEATKYMCVEKYMPIGQDIGRVKANSFSPQHKVVTYQFESCTRYSTNVLGSILSVTNNVCNLFKIHSTTGVISTNTSYYAPFLHNHFVLRASASNGQSVIVSEDLFVYVTDSGEMGRFQFSRTPLQTLPSFFNELKTDLNRMLISKYNDSYYFEYCNYQAVNSLDACFNVIHLKANRVFPYVQTKSIIEGLSGISGLFGQYSIALTERCVDREELANYEFMRGWDFSAEAKAFVAFVILGVLLTLLAILILVICWSSHMRQALLAPSSEVDMCDGASIDGLLDN